MAMNLGSIFKRVEETNNPVVLTEEASVSEIEACTHISQHVETPEDTQPRAFKFKIRGGGGTIITMAQTIEEVKHDLERQGWEVLSVTQAGGSND